jgi:aerobic-type carbon monoxide dehydrogenase small subunit (CoxS/CutS family)
MAKKGRRTQSGGARRKGVVKLAVNWRDIELEIGKGVGVVEPMCTLSFTLWGPLRLIGTKVSCDDGACGGCAIMMADKVAVAR